MAEILSRAAFEGEVRRRSMRVDLAYDGEKYVDPATYALWVGFRMAVSMLDEREQEKL